ncbi:MAG TPA: hypothetical protein VJM34_05595 [Novosphingobium sp.]|nr:hypothetical protein [Novosphingobium sp.]
MTETIARLHIALADTDPTIWRKVDVPVDATLKMLHDIIQGAMGWEAHGGQSSQAPCLAVVRGDVADLAPWSSDRLTGKLKIGSRGIRVHGTIPNREGRFSRRPTAAGSPRSSALRRRG